jgi:hypothetical protein
MFMRKLRLLSLLSLTILIVASCTKEGPEGPVGATGATGLPGSTGATGPAGATGQTNVTYSAWFTTTAANWVDTYQAPYWALFSYPKAAPGVTQAIMDNGIVLSYMKNWTLLDDNFNPAKSATIVQLPYIADPDLLDFYDFVLESVGTIRYMYKSNFQTWSNTELAGTSFRYVLIPGSIAGGKGTEPRYNGFTATELKAMPYAKVAQMFNLPADGTNIQ